MGRNVQISLETFGNKCLTATLTPEEIKGKNIGEIVKYMVEKPWNGEDKKTLEAIKKEMSASGGYSTEVATGEVFEPTKFQPVRLGEKIDQYVRDYGQIEDELRVAVIGEHEVGYIN
jgi:hypothetical protein